MDAIDLEEFDWERKQAARIQDEQDVEDRLIEMMAEWYDEWGCESLEEADHDQ
jgi:hypothetical protein